MLSASLDALVERRVTASSKRYGCDFGPPPVEGSNGCVSFSPLLTPLSDLFPCGIVLRSTARSLEKDIPDLIDAIRSEAKHLSEAQVDKALRGFYDQFPFEGKEVAEDLLNKAADEKMAAAETSAKKPAEKVKKKPSKEAKKKADEEDLKKKST